MRLWFGEPRSLGYFGKMWLAGLTACRRRLMNNAAVRVFRSADVVVGSSVDDAGKSLQCMNYHAAYSTVRALVRDETSVSQMHEKGSPSTSLAKSLACLPEESSTKKSRSRMEHKRSIENRIKKRVKDQYSNGKFYDLMGKVIANANTLHDSYDIIRLDSNIESASEKDGLCFVSMAEQLASGSFDVKANTFSLVAKSRRKECLVLPNLKLKIIQEAIRVVLEVVYRPHFSKISHGCRSGRGHRSALRYICEEIKNPDWWFTLRMNKETDASIVSKLVSAMEEKIEDTKLFSIIHLMFDSHVLNLVFGGFPKGQGLPQEGVLSPILMNIYLDMFDRELFRMFMRYEGLGTKDGRYSKLRRWFRRQMKDNDDEETEDSILRLHACRWMDEIFIAVKGSEEIALRLKAEIQNYLRNSLHLEVEDRANISAVDDSSRGVQFLGMVVRASARERKAVRAVHKLKDKLQLFASQKQEIWDVGSVRIGKKWLAHGLKRLKESEIEQLGLSTPTLDRISCFRKEGMRTDHWFKSLIKIWLQDVNAKVEADEEVVLSKFIAEPALPRDLRDSFYEFQKLVEEYVSSETAATLELLSDSNRRGAKTKTTTIEAPANFIRRRLFRYGLIDMEGFPRRVSALLLQDDVLIVHWFSGLIRRWLKWYSGFDNFQDIKIMMVECVRKSCIRTLAVKHRMHESEIEKRFDYEMSGIPLTEELESETVAMASDIRVADHHDEALTYGMSYCGLCVLSLARVKVPSRPLNCSVMGCSVGSPSLYTLHVKERQRFPGWKTGFSAAVHLGLNGRRIALCKQHVTDLYLGHITLQSVDFGALRR